MRIALGVEYDGSVFCGWQRQVQPETVQQHVETALSHVANEPVTVICAGRTDTGVHAIEQVIHMETTVQRDSRAWVLGGNTHLPPQISLMWAMSVAENFHARFSAIRRRYQYVILNRPVRPTYLHKRVTWAYLPMDELRMAEAAQLLVGEHDFSSYRAVACQASSPVRTIYQLDVTRRDGLIYIDIEANGFLHHMVRNIAGVLMKIGAGAQSPVWARQVLEYRNRRQGGVTARPDGLYLAQVTYPTIFNLPHLPPARVLW